MVLGVFVKTTVRRRGDKEYRYLSLVEAVRVDGRSTHRTLLRLGDLAVSGGDRIDRCSRGGRCSCGALVLEPSRPR